MSTTQTKKLAVKILRDLSKISEKVWEDKLEFKDILAIHQKNTRKYEEELKRLEN